MAPIILQPALINRNEHAKIMKPLGTSGFMKGESVLLKAIKSKSAILLQGSDSELNTLSKFWGPPPFMLPDIL